MRKFSNIDNFIKLILIKNVKINGGHRLRFEDMIAESARLF